MLDEFRRLALFTSGVAELTRHRAEQLVRDLVQSGDVRRDQASGLVKTVLDLGKQNRKELGQLIRSEIRNQIAALGVVTERDFERLERRVARIEDRQKAASGGTASKSSTSSPAKRTSAKTSKKSSARTAKKATARKKSSARTGTSHTSTAGSSTPSSGAGATSGPISDEGGPLKPPDTPRP